MSRSARWIRRPSSSCTINCSSCGSRSTVVFVTHDIGEAITLADRVVVLSKKGTGIADEICVDLPRPRSADALQADARYHDLYRRTWTSLKASTE
jgi:NitT/TauT family transport system ATP-binding protein